MNKKSNPAPSRANRTVVERGYFHTGNSGITITMVEESENHEWDEQDRDWYQHHLEIRHGAFGADSSFRTPIAGPVMCQYYIDAFTRLRDRMVADPHYRIPYPFERYLHGDVPTAHNYKVVGGGKRSDESHRIVDIANGLKREEVWSQEIIVSETATETRLLGHNFIDAQGTIMRFEPFTGEQTRAGKVNVARYRREDIGKPVAEVEETSYTNMAHTALEAEVQAWHEQGKWDVSKKVDTDSGTPV